jgi:hypothetical protein
MTSENIDLSSWDTLNMRNRNKLEKLSGTKSERLNKRQGQQKTYDPIIME